MALEITSHRETQNEPPLTLGSLFDGIGVFPLAASRHGIVPLWASEIEKAPISITRRHFPEMEHLGDITKMDGGQIPAVHILTLVLRAKTCLKSETVPVWLEPNQVCFIMQSELSKK